MEERSGQKAGRINQMQFEREVEQLKYCLEIGKEACKQEESRTESIKMRAENIVKYSTIFVAVANLVISLVNQGALETADIQVSVKMLYIGLMLAMIICIILAFIAQKPTRTEMFPDVAWMLEEILSQRENYEYENQRIYDMLLRYTSRTITMKKSNDSSLILVTASYVLYILSVILLMCLLVMTVRI